MRWSAEFSTGVPEVDQQHQALFKASEDYRLALNEGHGERVYAVLLDFLDEYSRAHFGFEEACMHRYRCPLAGVNADAHAEFLRQLSRYRHSFDAVGFQRDQAVGLLDFVDGWLTHHIARVDVQLKRCVEQAGES